MILCPWKDIARYSGSIPGLAEAIAAINAHDPKQFGSFPLPNGRFSVGEHTSHPVAGSEFESHRQYLDIQYVLSGQDVVGWAPVDALTPTGAFQCEQDIGFYQGTGEFIRVPAGYCYVVFPEDAHMPDCHLDQPTKFVKIVAKIKV